MGPNIARNGTFGTGRALLKELCLAFPHQTVDLDPPAEAIATLEVANGRTLWFAAGDTFPRVEGCVYRAR